MSSRDTALAETASPAPPPAPARRHRPPVTLVTLVVVAAVVAAAVAFSRLGNAVPTPRAGGFAGPPSTVSTRDLATDALLQRQAVALSAHDRAGYLAGWAASVTSQRQAALTYGNLARLGVATVEPVVDLASIGTGGASWTATVAVTWAMAKVDTAPATSALRYTFAEHASRVVVVAIATAASGREPVWLLPGLQVRRGARTLVVSTDPTEGARVERLLRGAVVAVGAVLPAWRGGLVAYVPAEPAQFDALIHARSGQYAGIAAVTTTVDGSSNSAAPTAIVVNPRVFDPLGPVSAEVVVTHEATHAATHAAAVSMPLWVAEGFADYVGIGAVHVPVPLAARAALAEVRRDGPPPALPADSAFAIGGARLEATYEQAWLATSLIARTYGQDRLVAFYLAVEARPDQVAQAFERVLHTTEPVFTRSWRGYLQSLARGA